MAIGSPPITLDLKHTGELWVYISTPLPNPSGNTGVMVCYTIDMTFATFRYNLCDTGLIVQDPGNKF